MLVASLPESNHSDECHRDLLRVMRSKRAMKLSGNFVCAGPFLLLLYAAPALAQFEINPDHFDNMVSQTPTKITATFRLTTARQHFGTPAAKQRSKVPIAEAQRARTIFSKNARAMSNQRHGYPGNAILGAKQFVKIQSQRHPSQIAQLKRE